MNTAITDIWTSLPAVKDSVIMALRLFSTTAVGLSSLLYLASAASAIPSLRPCHFPSLLNTSIPELGQLLQSGAITSQGLTEIYIQRIHEVNDNLHAVIELNPDALTIATQLDQERADTGVRGPLHGIPILVKDNYATNDKMLSGSGSVCLAPAPATIESTVITKLRAAGAIILGKANQHEFAGARGLNVTSGWSARGGQTFGAYVEGQTACGSSSGSGVAASLGLAAGTLGTDTAGSITCPAAYNNVVGIKPTVGLTSRYGVVPVTIRQDSSGPIAPSVADAAIILDAIAGVDTRDNYTLAQPWGNSPPNFVGALDASSLQSKRLGVVWLDTNPNSPGEWVNIDQIRRVFDAALADLEKAGAELVELSIFSGSSIPPQSLVPWVIGNMSIYGQPDLKEGIEGYIDTIDPDVGKVHDLKSLVECIQTDPREEAGRYDYSDISRLLSVNTTSDSLEAWKAYQAASGITRDLVAKLLADNNVDALVLLSDIALLVGAASGLPIVTVPMGAVGSDGETKYDFTNTTIETAPGMPLGISFMANRWSDVQLVSYAYAYEQVSHKRASLKPYLAPATDLNSLRR